MFWDNAFMYFLIITQTIHFKSTLRKERGYFALKKVSGIAPSIFCSRGTYNTTVLRYQVEFFI
jgi:hypothetical protein